MGIMAAVGGVSEARQADADVQKIVDEVKSAAEASANKTFSQFQAVKVATQVVAGTMFFIKVQADDEFVHLKVFRSLPPFTHELQGIQTGKTADDALAHF